MEIFTPVNSLEIKEIILNNHMLNYHIINDRIICEGEDITNLTKRELFNWLGYSDFTQFN